jgi:hypothetical protein
MSRQGDISRVRASGCALRGVVPQAAARFNAAMSDPTHDPTSHLPSEANADELADFLDSAVPPRSKWAWSGFILAVALIVPWVALAFRGFLGQRGLLTGAAVGAGLGVVATILGIVGIFHTRKRRRRGRAVAIAAIPMGLVFGMLQGIAGVAIFQIVSVTKFSDQAVQVLRSPQAEVTTQAESWHAEFTAKRFQVSVPPDQLAGWLNAILAEHGQLQSAALSKKAPIGSERGSMVCNLIGQFVNGSAPIELVVGFDEPLKPKIDDIRVDGSSPRAYQPPADDAANSP